METDWFLWWAETRASEHAPTDSLAYVVLVHRYLCMLRREEAAKTIRNSLHLMFGKIGV